MPSRLIPFLALGSLALGISGLLSGCGGGKTPVPPVTNPPAPAATTKVVVLATSTANDRLAQFWLGITSIALNDPAGNSVTLLSRPNQGGAGGVTEFMRLNGGAQALAAATVPQGTYTSATIKVGYCQFAWISVVSGGSVLSIDAQGLCGQGTGNTTVNLPAPITISGAAMALSFDLQVSQSYSLTPSNSYTISPVFTLRPVAIAANPTSFLNGKINGVNALVVSVNESAGTFVAQSADGNSLTYSTGNNTEYHGVGGLASLAAGALVNMDSAIQADGTLRATRVQVDNAAAVTADLEIPITPASPAGTAVAEVLECFPAPGTTPVCISDFVSFGGTVFHLSGEFKNLQGLPFTPQFSSSDFVLGQNVLVASTSSTLIPGGIPATDITLEPQTINGTVTGVSNSGLFSVYTVAIAPYNVFPTSQQLALVSPFAAIPSPATIVVYADSSAQLLQSGAIVPGSLLRFKGLIFEDSGTLRMDCAEILDGVAE